MSYKKKYEVKEEHTTKGLVRVSACTRRFISFLLDKKDFLLKDIIKNWDSIVGKELSSNTEALKLDIDWANKKKAKLTQDYILYIKVSSNAYSSQCIALSQNIITKANSFINPNRISSIKTIIGTINSPKNKIIEEKKKEISNDDIEKIEANIPQNTSDELKNALLKFSIAIFKKK
ncbi:MAG: DUF721 domain-containing protein [Alphaproteobacteria bacterium]|nr:DUF721 domain-containing protein [Alphaproteobacteria bacterium]